MVVVVPLSPEPYCMLGRIGVPVISMDATGGHGPLELRRPQQNIIYNLIILSALRNKIAAASSDHVITTISAEPLAPAVECDTVSCAEWLPQLVRYPPFQPGNSCASLAARMLQVSCDTSEHGLGPAIWQSALSDLSSGGGNRFGRHRFR